ncbi:MupA/Atu3671 family FMN-dependent luciferase-like monooxygenase [Streptosporangium subroseum]|uniref:MupA/Atu3671 family FMN-dependent luciferase-like monooxygenase n=1 Tax=Streptosporangium subroseum TaxID=106412 RepID=UPI00341CAC2B
MSTVQNLPVAVSLSYFSASGGSGPTGSPYDVLLDSARLGDEAGLEAVWLPERHFADFGYLYPNPSVPAAAVAATTSRIGIRAGSVVMPLHHPARVAEEWAVIDQLSGGRVGVSFASGWNGSDFVLSRSDVSERRQVMREGIEAVSALWRGESRTFPDASGRMIELRTYPRPVQSELPVWLTAGGSVGTFELAGSVGANVLTHLVGQSPEDLRDNIAAYRKARQTRGDGRGHITLMLHTHILDGSRGSADRVQQELARYLTSSMKLDERNVADAERAAAFRSLNTADRETIAMLGASRFLDFGLICTADEVRDRLAEVDAWDVDEVACLIDFGFEYGPIMKSLEELLGVLS